MKAIEKKSSEKSFKSFGFDLLNELEMKEICGGGQPKTRDKDMFDDEEE